MKKHSHIIITLSVCLLAAVSGCGRKDMPKGVMDSVTMVGFLTEAYQIEGYNSVVIGSNPDSLGYRLNAAYDSLFKKYGITPADYDSSVAYYVRRPNEFEAIYKQVVQNLKDDLNGAETKESVPLEE